MSIEISSDLSTRQSHIAPVTLLNAALRSDHQTGGVCEARPPVPGFNYAGRNPVLRLYATFERRNG
jgi:hypothetical protein